ncbi:TlpA family protein disulfide reductase [Roseivirga misakiensis]|uniref:Thioredoxin domain-containing protein n=1 Tax=Roseivirga misakiensis TaxID=1563681 RepID=A0A1E5T4N9_9BACT|nr:TlpA disulfide reductase family protein [Roseivirga misakiensis]OEK06345.1 hypothetical protein BFP71_01320 [Roseivirga misakiensis]
MKKLFTATILFISTLSFAQQDVVNLTIKKEGFGKKNKFTIYLDDERLTPDSEGKIIYEGSREIDKVIRGRVIMPNGRYGDFWLEPGDMDVTIKKSGFPKTMEVIGSETDALYKYFKYTKDITQVEKRILEDPEHVASLNYLAGYYKRHSNEFLSKLIDGYSEETQQKLSWITAYVKTSDMKKVAKGTQLYHFTAKTQSGETINTKDFAGKYLLLDFASTGCGPCWQGYPEMIKTVSKYEDLQVLTFNEDNQKETWNKFAKARNLDIKWPVLWDSEEKFEIFEMYEIEGWPSFFLISPEGKVLEEWFGAGKTKLKNALKKHLD